jgi:hypothetical protein
VRRWRTQSLIDASNQQFAFELIDTAGLLGTPAIGTVGGMIGAGLRRSALDQGRRRPRPARSARTAVSGLRRQLQTAAR